MPLNRAQGTVDMPRRCLLLFVLLTAAVSLASEPALETTTSWDGGEIAYPEGQPQITAKILRLEVGEQVPFHCHPVPTMGYVLRGTVKVDLRDGRSQEFDAGSSLVEVMNTLHRGSAVGGGVEIIVFYAGAVGTPTTIIPEPDDPKGCRE